MTLYDRIQETSGWLKNTFTLRPEIILILGSGLKAAQEILEDPQSRPYEEIPHFPRPTVPGHEGRLWVGKLAETPIAFFEGRSHFYEGIGLESATFAIRAAAAWGVSVLLLTNSAGGIREDLQPGDIMIIRDHLNLMGVNPLHGMRDKRLGDPFVTMTGAYDPRIREILKQSIQKTGGIPKEGVYAAVGGPSYETPAEVRMLASLGTDAVGMSTVPEVIVARQLNLRVGALSCITNRAAGLNPDGHGHEEVLQRSKAMHKDLLRLLKDALPEIGKKI